MYRDLSCLGHLAYPVEGASSKAFASRDLLRPLPKIFARIGAISATSSVDVSFQDTGTAQQESDGHMDWALIKLKQELLCPNAVDIPQQGSVAIVDVASNMEPWVNKRTVSIVTGMSGVVEGSLSTSPARLLLGSKTFLVYCITLSNPLSTFTFPLVSLVNLNRMLIYRSSWRLGCLGDQRKDFIGPCHCRPFFSLTSASAVRVHATDR